MLVLKFSSRCPNVLADTRVENVGEATAVLANVGFLRTSHVVG
jgi:hypothetical protein